MNTAGSTSRQRALVILICLSVGIVAIFIGLLGAVSSWYLQVLVISVAVPGVLLLVDYKIGLALIIVLMPYSNSPLLPKAGPVSMVNVLLLGVGFSFIVRWLVFRLGGKQLEVPIPRELFWFYLVPFTVAMLIGTTHLDEIPQHLYAIKLSSGEEYGLRDYWISFYFKTMLLVGCIFALGAAVIESDKSYRFANLVVFSGCLYTIGIILVVILSGYSLDQLKNMRASLRPLGFHNNDAGYMLMWPFAIALFMREFAVSAFGRLVLTASAVFVFCGILLTFSRGGFLAAVAVVAYYLWHFRRLRASLLIASFAVVALIFAPDAIRDRLLTGLEDKSVVDQVASRSGSGDELTAGRVYIWRNMAPEILRSPLFGRGVDSGMWSDFVKNGSIFSHPHNMYLSILMDLGIIGAVCLVIVFRYVWRMFGRLAQDNRLRPSMRGYFSGARAGLLGMLAGAISSVAYYPATHQVFLWISVGLALGCVGRLNSSAEFDAKKKKSENNIAMYR